MNRQGMRRDQRRSAAACGILPPDMFDIEACADRKVYLFRFHGPLTEADFAALDALARDRKGDPPYDCIFDMSDVDKVELATEFVSKRGELPQAHDGRARIYVVPQQDLKLLVRLYAAYQASKGWRPPDIVETLEQAFGSLGVAGSDFRPAEGRRRPAGGQPRKRRRGEASHSLRLAKKQALCCFPSHHPGQGVMSNIVNLKPRRRGTTAAARVVDDVHASTDLRALQELQALCAKAIEAGGLDAGGPTALDFTVAVHRAVKATEWRVRFYRGQGSGR
jgi:hypothetical protein